MDLVQFLRRDLDEDQVKPFDYLASLRPEHLLGGMVVIASAGTGKTHTCTRLFSLLRSRGLNTYYTTYNKHLALDNEARYSQLVKNSFGMLMKEDKNRICTFDSLMYKIILEGRQLLRGLNASSIVYHNKTIRLDTMDCLIVDEAQDLTEEKIFIILQKIKPKFLIVSGDPRQSIYQHLGSTSRLLFEMMEQYPHFNIRISKRFRIKNICDLVNEVASHKKQSFEPLIPVTSQEDSERIYLLHHGFNYDSLLTKIDEIIQHMVTHMGFKLHQFLLLFPAFGRSDNSSLRIRIRELIGQSPDRYEVNWDETTKSIKGDKVLITTVHRAKGQEADIVFLINCFEGVLGFGSTQTLFNEEGVRKKMAKNGYSAKRAEEYISNYKTSQEEQANFNLLYVAVSRAREYLFLCLPESLFRDGKMVRQSPAFPLIRFLNKAHQEKMNDSFKRAYGQTSTPLVHSIKISRAVTQCEFSERYRVDMTPIRCDNRKRLSYPEFIRPGWNFDYIFYGSLIDLFIMIWYCDEKTFNFQKETMVETTKVQLPSGKVGTFFDTVKTLEFPEEKTLLSVVSLASRWVYSQMGCITGMEKLLDAEVMQWFPVGLSSWQDVVDRFETVVSALADGGKVKMQQHLLYPDLKTLKTMSEDGKRAKPQIHGVADVYYPERNIVLELKTNVETNVYKYNMQVNSYACILKEERGKYPATFLYSLFDDTTYLVNLPLVEDEERKLIPLSQEKLLRYILDSRAILDRMESLSSGV